LLKSPYPFFGGKSAVATEVWRRFGSVQNYVEPFFGSGAILLSRPKPIGGAETVNDLDGFIANFWRAVQSDPARVASFADWPASENDLHARHSWLVGQKTSLQAQLEGDPDFFDAKIAGWWIWGISLWIGGGFCSGDGPWQSIEGRLITVGDQRTKGQGVMRRGLHLGDKGRGIMRRGQEVYEYFEKLQARLRRVRVASGDWQRVCGESVTIKHGLTAVFLDPPYGADRDKIYNADGSGIASAVRDWCKIWGGNQKMRIALCGYTGEHESLESLGWKRHEWRAHGGYANQAKGSTRGKENKHKERIWFSPHCINMGQQPGLW
jgi:DNA adenine methylase